MSESRFMGESRSRVASGSVHPRSRSADETVSGTASGPASSFASQAAGFTHLHKIVIINSVWCMAYAGRLAFTRDCQYQ